MRTIGKLTTLAVNAAKRRGLYGDGGGLYLQVGKSGSKAWVFRFMVDGQAHKLGLGPVHTVTLAEARRRAAAARLKVHDGIDPIADRRAERARQRVAKAKACTFKQAADAFIAAKRSEWSNSKHAAQWAGTFTETKRGKRKYPAATADINALPVSAIDLGLVLKVLKPLWARTPETASRVRGRIESVLDWARVHGYRDGENPARWKGHLAQILPKRRKATDSHHAAVDYADMPAFMDELRSQPGVTARALEFTILTAARTGESLGARWAEIDEGARLWTIPARRTKTKREHRIPLADRALAILGELPRESDDGFVFMGGRFGRPLGHAAMLGVIQALRPGAGFTTHGFRSTFRDWAGDATTFPRELAEAALAHAVGDMSERAYRRSDALARRRELMEAWARFCASPATAKVVPLRG